MMVHGGDKDGWGDGAYIVVEAESLEKLVQEVRKHVRVGYQPLGAPFVTEWWPNAKCWPEQLPPFLFDIGYDPVKYAQALTMDLGE